MADTIHNLDVVPMTVGVSNAASGRLNGVPGEVYDITNIGESGMTCYFNLRPFTWSSTGAETAELLSAIATGTTGALHLQAVGVGGQIEWRPDPAHPYIDCVTTTGTTVLSIKRRGS